LIEWLSREFLLTDLRLLLLPVLLVAAKTLNTFNHHIREKGDRDV